MKKARGSRGQGAMEYLMTYGWAILVVMVVGIAMWRMGVFDMGGASTPTSTGFQAIKPLLATCEIRDAYNYPGVTINGFRCQFTNNAGAPIGISEVRMRADNRDCLFTWATDTYDYQAGVSRYVVYGCTGQDACGSFGCFDEGEPLGVCEDGLMWIASGDQFSIAFGSDTTTTFGPCHLFEEGERYDISAEIDYWIDVGGVDVQRSSIGTVSMLA